MTAQRDPVTASKEIVLGVLEGNYTRESHPHIFEEDVLFLSVGQLESAVPDWLVETLRKERFSKPHRRLVASAASSEIRAQLSSVLG